MVFEVCLHHMGKFVSNKGLQYLGGEVHMMKGLDPDRWSYFEAVGIVKEFKYDADFKLWWKGSKERLMNNLRLLSDDREALNSANYVEENKEEVEIYVQHVPSEAMEVHFLSCGEEADEGNIEDMEEVAEIVEDGGMGLEEGDGAEEHEEVEMGKEDEQEGYGGEEQEEVDIGEEEVDCDGGEEQEDVNFEEGDGGDEHDYLHKEEEGGNVVEGEVEASTEDCLDESEEERMTNDDDGFSVENDRVDHVRRNIIIRQEALQVQQDLVVGRQLPLQEVLKQKHLHERHKVGDFSTRRTSNNITTWNIIQWSKTCIMSPS
ncbi:hypothetical protein LR48_Vigan07g249200 [Vigna angularis]|uniref:PB1-like domain-containing protein n=1 Tax=Phaseolus angularis TaxID=3914 RepID=A0A0L9V171_PHAAN|nr:hypothetical protein LR48_Vigan07g249200 [Vigna angularis]